MKKKISHMDMGGMYSGMMSSDTNSAMPEPVSGYGTSQSSTDPPWRPKTAFGRGIKKVFGIGDNKGSQPQRHTSPNASRSNIRNNKGGSKCYKGKCR